MIAVSQQLALLGSVRRVERRAQKTGGRHKCNSDRLHHCLEDKSGVFFPLHDDYLLSGCHITAVSYQVLEWVKSKAEIGRGQNFNPNLVLYIDCISKIVIDSTS